MKKQFLVCLALMLGLFFRSNAQWSPLNSTTTANLHDVDFLNSTYGVIVGDAGTILLTTDGGLTWNSINSHGVNMDIHSVRVINTDTIMVSNYDRLNAESNVYFTSDAGVTWTPVLNDLSTNHKIDLEIKNNNSVFAVGSDLQSTTDNGANWKVLENNTGGQTSLDLVRFADSNVGQISGLISGFLTYSASFFRTEDQGQTWYPSDYFSFPNADALTTMCFKDPDTVLMFTNHYAGFVPGTQNGLVKLSGFQQYVPFPGDTQFQFTSQVINANTPAYMNDAHYMNAANIFSAGDDGVVYHSTDAGITWTIDYNTGAHALHAFSFVDNIGYVVGADGTLLKYSSATGIPVDGKQYEISLYPNPVSDKLIVKMVNHTTNRILKARIHSINGRFIKEVGLKDNINTIDVSNLPSGTYELILELDGKRQDEHLPWVKI